MGKYMPAVHASAVLGHRRVRPLAFSLYYFARKPLDSDPK